MPPSQRGRTGELLVGKEKSHGRDRNGGIYVRARGAVYKCVIADNRKIELFLILARSFLLIANK